MTGKPCPLNLQKQLSIENRFQNMCRIHSKMSSPPMISIFGVHLLNIFTCLWIIWFNGRVLKWWHFVSIFISLPAFFFFLSQLVGLRKDLIMFFFNTITTCPGTILFLQIYRHVDNKTHLVNPQQKEPNCVSGIQWKASLKGHASNHTKTPGECLWRIGSTPTQLQASPFFPFVLTAIHNGAQWIKITFKNGFISSLAPGLPPSFHTSIF